ncbi:MAG: class I SAM-dependent methyltransferase [Candidatus Pacearchaeota archaeon]|nr:class I SAM-dependent methyltransferase [Candidatus Pacearchaeota archaeon]
MLSNEELKQIYGEAYVESFKNKPLQRLIRILDYIKVERTSTVVDFACGNAMLMELIAPKVKSYTGVDFSDSFIKASNIKKESLSINNAEFFCSDINEFCQHHPNFFDVGFAMDFSEHVYDAEWLQILKNIRTSLKKNGKLYLHTPNAEFFLEKMKSKNLVVKQLHGHIAVRTPEHNATLLREAGFNITHTWLISHYNNALKIVHPLSFLPVIGKFFKARILIEATT